MGYFLQRHHPGCRIEIIVPREKDEHIAAMVRNNLAFMERILKHSEARYEVVNEEKSFEKMPDKGFAGSFSGDNPDDASVPLISLLLSLYCPALP